MNNIRINNGQKKHNYSYLNKTLSTCPYCLELVDTKIVIETNKVFFIKNCQTHGISKALVSEDAEYYLNTFQYTQPGSIPFQSASCYQKGCPFDCGLCNQHEQHTCHPIIEITDYCNLNCPICFVNNNDSYHMDVDVFSMIIENLIESEGHLENITLSGGEPTLHPRFWELVNIAKRPEIARISIVTNGIRLAQDRDFCRRMKENDLYAILQWDGFDNGVYHNLRGIPLLDIKNNALRNLMEDKISTQLIYVVVKRVNDDQLGQSLDLLLEKESILSIVYQPLSLEGKNGSKYPHDPLDRITIPGIINKLSEQSNGLLKKEDFFPLPCPNPQCVSLTYLLMLEEGSYTPMTRFINVKEYLNIFSRSATLPPDRKTEEVFHRILTDLWSTSGENPENQKIVNALKRVINEIYPKENINYQNRIKISEKQAKSIFIHHYMDRYNFDISRVVKCCHHYPKPDQHIYPICSYNLFYREKKGKPTVVGK